ncbi:DUF1489 family protein [Propylenella binzhouense]|uniref:DUF1489 family protein n=1 Tax=Propylenella binzhouense TaxID=2555902 RepID=A0A964WSP2_9HYPH|nr:DUF1489 family protein [Propylenella binzhouense]MYZ47179.1 DUF1489 family protein [Propylenella binzhouense]
MALHLVKLCVGCDSVEDLQDWVERRLAEMRRNGEAAEQRHTTRMAPKRAEELLDGGSLYWVIRGNIQVRQRLLDIRPFTDGEGTPRCHLVLEPVLVQTAWQPRRAFQGWRYLPAADAPSDAGAEGGGFADLPAALGRELAELGLL